MTLPPKADSFCKYERKKSNEMGFLEETTVDHIKTFDYL